MRDNAARGAYNTAPQAIPAAPTQSTAPLTQSVAAERPSLYAERTLPFVGTNSFGRSVAYSYYGFSRPAHDYIQRTWRSWGRQSSRLNS